MISAFIHFLPSMKNICPRRSWPYTGCEAYSGKEDKEESENFVQSRRNKGAMRDKYDISRDESKFDLQTRLPSHWFP